MQNHMSIHVYYVDIEIVHELDKNNNSWPRTTQSACTILIILLVIVMCYGPLLLRFLFTTSVCHTENKMTRYSHVPHGTHLNACTSTHACAHIHTHTHTHSDFQGGNHSAWIEDELYSVIQVNIEWGGGSIIAIPQTQS